MSVKCPWIPWPGITLPSSPRHTPYLDCSPTPWGVTFSLRGWLKNVRYCLGCWDTKSPLLWRHCTTKWSETFPDLIKSPIWACAYACDCKDLGAAMLLTSLSSPWLTPIQTISMNELLGIVKSAAPFFRSHPVWIRFVRLGDPQQSTGRRQLVTYSCVWDMRDRRLQLSG